MRSKFIPIPILGLSLSLAVILAVTVTLTLAPTTSAQVTIPGVISTGVDASGNLLAAGQTDPYWTITSSPVSTGAISALVTSPLHRFWIGNTTSSQWINATGIGTDSEPVGLYVYTLTFSLSGFNPSTAEIWGNWASDNQSEIYLNGIDLGYGNGTNGFEDFQFFSIGRDFVSGENTLQFYVFQDSPSEPGEEDPEGLQVNIMNATAEAVPEPDVATLLLITLIVFWMLRVDRAATVRERAGRRG
jgi:hypothetical protein